MRIEKGGVVAVAGLTAWFGGPFAFAFGYGVGHNGVEHVEPTQTETAVTTPYSQELLRCVGQKTLKLTYNNQSMLIPVDSCQQAELSP